MPQLFVQGQTLHTLEVSQETTVSALKSALVAAEGVPAEEQVLIYGGVPLEDDCVLAESVPELATLSVTVRVIGGKWRRKGRRSPLFYLVLVARGVVRLSFILVLILCL